MSQTTRRDALKALAAATGAVTLASLPSRWSKPVLRVGAVPAHAQSSCFDLIVEFIPRSAGGTFQYFDLPPADAGDSNPASGSSGSVRWVWNCGTILDPVCFDLIVYAASPDADLTVYGRDGSMVMDFLAAGESVALEFVPSTGTIFDNCLL